MTRLFWGHNVWNEVDKYKKGKLNNTAVMSSCVSVQPFGYNGLGGKLMSLVANKRSMEKEI